MMWIVPPVVYPASRCRLSVSATTPWPGNAASPWMRIGSTVSGLNVGAPGMRRVGARGARHALDHRVDRLEVARIRRHRDHQVHLLAAVDRPRRAQVVLDVAAPLDALELERVAHRILELGQDLLVRLAHHVRHHVQPAAMRHPDERLRAARPRRPRDMTSSRIGTSMSSPSIEKRVLPGNVRCRKRSKTSTSVSRSSSATGIDRIGRRAVPAGLDRLPQPAALFGDEDVRHVVAGRRAVELAQPLDDVPHRVGALGDRPPWRAWPAGRAGRPR